MKRALKWTSFFWSKISSITQFAGEIWNVPNFETYRYIKRCSEGGIFVLFWKRGQAEWKITSIRNISNPPLSVFLSQLKQLHQCFQVLYDDSKKRDIGISSPTADIFGFQKPPRSQAVANWSSEQHWACGSMELDFRCFRNLPACSKIAMENAPNLQNMYIYMFVGKYRDTLYVALFHWNVLKLFNCSKKDSPKYWVGNLKFRNNWRLVNLIFPQTTFDHALRVPGPQKRCDSSYCNMYRHYGSRVFVLFCVFLIFELLNFFSVTCIFGSSRFWSWSTCFGDLAVFLGEVLQPSHPKRKWHSSFMMYKKGLLPPFCQLPSWYLSESM